MNKFGRIRKQASFVAQLVKNLPAMQETRVGKMPWRRERLPTKQSMESQRVGQE